MTQDEIIEMAKLAGFEEHQAKFDTRFEPFAKLVAKHTLLNIDPSKFTSWQDGFEVGVQKSRQEFDVLFAEHQKLLGELQAMRLARDEEDFC